MFNSNTYWCKESFSWKVPPPTDDFDPWFSKDEGQRTDHKDTQCVIFKLINLWMILKSEL